MPSRPGIGGEDVEQQDHEPIVDTTAAALLRVTVDSSTPIATTVNSGIR